MHAARRFRLGLVARLVPNDRFVANRSAARPLSSTRAMSGDGEAPAKFKIWTKTGDKGKSSLYNGERRGKDDATFWALGTVDELTCSIGVAREWCKDVLAVSSDAAENSKELGLSKDVFESFYQIQCRLQDVGSAVATPMSTSSETKITRVQFPKDAVTQLEDLMDRMDEELPALRSFILPGGGKASALLHVARAVCRRAERTVVPLVEQGLTEEPVRVYLNRLSDYLFTAARYAALKEGVEEVTYKKL